MRSFAHQHEAAAIAAAHRQFAERGEASCVVGALPQLGHDRSDEIALVERV